MEEWFGGWMDVDGEVSMESVSHAPPLAATQLLVPVNDWQKSNVECDRAVPCSSCRSR